MLFTNQIEKIYRKSLYVRNDNAGGIFYFGPDDFPGLQAHAYSFLARAGHGLRGYFYHYGPTAPGRLIVFDHGMGNGHRAYMREIEQLARMGYLVFSYDHTGCMESGGDSTNGFAQSLSDLDACICALKGEAALRDRAISVVGHSWGGFSTMNIVALHPEITHVVSMAGFISVGQMLRQTFGGPMKGYCKEMFALEQIANPDYVNYNAVESLSKTDAKVLLIYSDDDSVISRKFHFDPLSDGLAGRENIRFLLVGGKDHNPSYAVDAIRYKKAFFTAYKKTQKQGMLASAQQQKEFMSRYDWHRMTEQDPVVWEVIENHLAK